MKLKILVKTRKQTQFWVRAFKLESEIDNVRKILDEDSRRKRASVPIIAEYVVDEECKFLWVLVLEVDSLGLQSGMGFVFITDEENEAEVYAARDAIANDVLAHMEWRKYDEVIEIPEGKEE